MSNDARPEVRAAIVKGAICEGVFIVTGIVIYFLTQSLPALFACIALGGVALLLILLQAGAFTRPNDRA